MREEQGEVGNHLNYFKMSRCHNPSRVINIFISLPTRSQPIPFFLLQDLFLLFLLALHPGANNFPLRKLIIIPFLFSVSFPHQTFSFSSKFYFLFLLHNHHRLNVLFLEIFSSLSFPILFLLITRRDPYKLGQTPLNQQNISKVKHYILRVLGIQTS